MLAVAAEVPPGVGSGRSMPEVWSVARGAGGRRPGFGGQAWGFGKPEDRAEAERRIERDPPPLLVGSPPCTDWCALRVHLNRPRLEPADVAERRRRARAHLGLR